MVVLVSDSQKTLQATIAAVQTVRITTVTVQATALEIHEQMAMVILDHSTATMITSIKMEHELINPRHHRRRTIRMVVRT